MDTRNDRADGDGLRCGLVVLTKIDRADTAQANRVRREIEQLVAGTFLEAAPIICVLAMTGGGST